MTHLTRQLSFRLGGMHERWICNVILPSSNQNMNMPWTELYIYISLRNINIWKWLSYKDCMDDRFIHAKIDRFPSTVGAESAKSLQQFPYGPAYCKYNIRWEKFMFMMASFTELGGVFVLNRNAVKSLKYSLHITTTHQHTLCLDEIRREYITLKWRNCLVKLFQKSIRRAFLFMASP